ncbi:MAG: D-2-hydroxyacid dehydrogenase [Chitinophagales bacterium]
MKIVILDAYTLNPSDLSWEKIRSLGETTIYDYTPPHLTVERSKNADILIINKVVISEEILQQLPKLKFIALTATGFNNIDIRATQKRNIPVSNIRNYGTPAVAQHTFALLLALTNHVADHHQSVIDGQWQQTRDFCFWNKPLIELHNKTMGIVGFGQIGQKVAEIAKSFGMKIIAFQPSMKASFRNDILFTNDMKKLFSESDIISLHCTLKAENQGFVNKKLLQCMRKTAYLINTARGALINEKDLYEALQNGTIAGAALDVLCVEPPTKKNILFDAPNCIITPHNAWASFESRSRMMDLLYENMMAFLAGKPKNLIV